MILKFRAWDKTTSKLHVVNGIYCDNKKIHYIDDNRVRFVGFDNVIIMQSTGLFDKNNKEIFEGDIISDGHTSRDIRHHQTLGFYTIDGNGVEGFFGDTASLEDFEEVSKYMFENIAIIGNIYENPELLEGSE